MKIGIIDIGSNSVRLAIMADGKTLYKRLLTTRLGEGLSFTGKMSPAAIERTAAAVSSFKTEAVQASAQKIYAFATAAVRSSSNREEFISAVYNKCGLTVEVLSGEDEAKAGLLGALKGGDGGIIDIGGASTEVTVQSGGKVLYSKSLNIGTVRLFDLAGRDIKKLNEIILEKIAEYGEVDFSAYPMYAIGGTATRVASVKHGLLEYVPQITDGTVIPLEEAGRLADKLLTLSVEEIRATTMCKDSADVVGGGCLLMYNLMKKFGIKQITVSESDNLEGFYMLKECGK